MKMTFIWVKNHVVVFIKSLWYHSTLWADYMNEIDSLPERTKNQTVLLLGAAKS